jgi:hypothetical protein
MSAAMALPLVENRPLYLTKPGRGENGCRLFGRVQSSAEVESSTCPISARQGNGRGVQSRIACGLRPAQKEHNVSEGPKYPWQKLVVDAFTAPSESLSAKVEIAQQRIADRLNQQPHPDPEEELALRDALNALRVLVPQKTAEAAPKKGKAKKGIA